MLGSVAAFEFRYQVRSPLFAVATALLFIGAFVDMSVGKLLTVGGGHVLSNSPHAIIVSHLLVSFVFLFVGAAFVSNVIVRDDLTGFGPIIRSSGITKAHYLFGRFLGAFAVAALMMAAVPLAQWLGTLMPFADAALLGPNRIAGFAYGYGLFALPNALIICAVLFALATLTRSTAGTFLGVVGFLVAYFLSQGLMAGQPQLLTARVLADPLGMTAYMASSRYFTAAELNAGAVPVTRLMVWSRVLWGAGALALLLMTYRRFRFSERAPSRRSQRRARSRAANDVAAVATSPIGFVATASPRFDRRTARRQFIARAAMEARYIVKSPLFLILLVIAFVFTLPTLLNTTGWYGVALYPSTAAFVPALQATFQTLLVIIASYYAGELVWRERERGMHEIIDATPLPAWVLMLPKLLGLVVVLTATLLVGMGAGLLVQMLKGGVAVAPADYVAWYLVPGVADAVVVAALAVFVQALSPGKYAGWGVMALYLVGRTLAPSLGLEHPLFVYGGVPAVPLSDMVGTGVYWKAAWWFRLCWAAVAILLAIGAHLLWPRGNETALKLRLRRVPLHATRAIRAMALGAGAVFAFSAAWIVYNTFVLNDFRTADSAQRYLAEYEKRYLRYAGMPQPAVKHVELDVALFPEAMRADVRGRYRLVNETPMVIERVHVRVLNRDLHLLQLDFPHTHLEHRDDAFGYRIYRLDAPMRPGDVRSLAFRARREQVGFRATGTETSLAPNGTDLDTFELTPRIGMTDIGLIDDPAVRREYGLPAQNPFPRLDDLAATRTVPGGDVTWTTADITVSTSSDQVPIAPGRRVAERVEHGRRIARFVSDTPIKNFFSIQSGRYAVRRAVHAGVEHAIYFHPAHHWNVDRMMMAMQTSIDYYGKAFGPYQFDRMRIVETPAYREGGQAFANTVPMGETAAFTMDLRDPSSMDMASLVTAHEVAHQWWGHQVVGARMQGAGLLSETLAQYSALMVMKRLHGEAGIHRFLQFQLDRYLSGRRTQVLSEQPLARVEIGQQHIAYGKGALAFYLLQQRIGEDAVNRALHRFVERYRFTTAPYPRSTDLIALLREEAPRAEDQALITDLFERITLYDLKVTTPTATARADGAWDVTVPVEAHKFYADGAGQQTEAPLDEPIDVVVFSGDGAAMPERAQTRRLRVRTGAQVVHIVTRERPTHATIDPDGLYIDRSSADNTAKIDIVR